MLKVAVAGAYGKMGMEVCKAVVADPELELTSVVDPSSANAEDAMRGIPEDVQSVTSVTDLDPSEVDVIVDFTHARAAVSNINWALDNGVHSVVGTTGIAPEDMEDLAEKASTSSSNVVIAPNFAIGAVLMMKFAETASRFFDQCEIVELHHRGKRDAPSGTSIATARKITEQKKKGESPEIQEGEITGSRGGLMGGVNIHSVRLDGLVAHQEVIFGSSGQTLTVRHDTTDRSCFMPGVLMAVKAIDGMPGLTIGLEPILGI